MPRSTKPSVLVRPCVVCRKPFEATNPQRICCSLRCRRARLRLRRAVGAEPWVSDEDVFAALSVIKGLRLMHPMLGLTADRKTRPFLGSVNGTLDVANTSFAEQV
jgi:hypothetical protein